VVFSRIRSLASAPRAVWTSISEPFATRRTTVLSETRPRGRPDASSGSARGPGVRRVPRRPAGRANGPVETHPRVPTSRILEARRRGLGPSDAQALAAAADTRLVKVVSHMGVQSQTLIGTVLRSSMAVNVSDVHEAPEPGVSPAEGFPRPSWPTTFTTRAASARKRTLREILLLDAVGLAGSPTCRFRIRLPWKRA
jgi:hypothetical protein